MLKTHHFKTGGKRTMNDCIINSNEIFLQSIICDEVMKNPQQDNIEIYNSIVLKTDISCIEQVERILTLIKMNKQALSYDLA